ncbi:MAG: hypothetical protein Sylvanvirus6_29 [Sylvanvirus sp.]|uniref:Uncharacterized protein n=1 Tax=Sylvanvirus sp. TaxID=2487774 RepID=A0A3G5AHQ9_9VIRU|nr:MAG: hypothetical protein Sylvanvirus6_29 [Sylvanvirus sp.]
MEISVDIANSNIDRRDQDTKNSQNVCTKTKIIQRILKECCSTFAKIKDLGVVIDTMKKANVVLVSCMRSLRFCSLDEWRTWFPQPMTDVNEEPSTISNELITDRGEKTSRIPVDEKDLLLSDPHALIVLQIISHFPRVYNSILEKNNVSEIEKRFIDVKDRLCSPLETMVIDCMKEFLCTRLNDFYGVPDYFILSDPICLKYAKNDITEIIQVIDSLIKRGLLTSLPFPLEAYLSLGICVLDLNFELPH